MGIATTSSLPDSPTPDGKSAALYHIPFPEARTAGGEAQRRISRSRFTSTLDIETVLGSLITQACASAHQRSAEGQIGSAEGRQSTQQAYECQ